MDYDEELKDTLQSDIFESNSSYLAVLSFLIFLSAGLHTYTSNISNAIANSILGITLSTTICLLLFIHIFKHPKIWLSSTNKKVVLVLFLYDITISFLTFSVLNKVWKSPSSTNTESLPNWYYNELALNKQNIWMPFTGMGNTLFNMNNNPVNMV